MLRSEVEHSQRASDVQALFLRGNDTLPVIHQQQVCMESRSQSDGRSLALMNSSGKGNCGRLCYFEPGRDGSGPALNGCWRELVRKFSQHYTGNNHPLE